MQIVRIQTQMANRKKSEIVKFKRAETTRSEIVPNGGAECRGKQMCVCFLCIRAWLNMNICLIKGQNRTGYISCMLTFDSIDRCI